MREALGRRDRHQLRRLHRRRRCRGRARAGPRRERATARATCGSGGGRRRVVYVSTDYVFDGAKAIALRGIRSTQPDLGLRPLQAGGRGRHAREQPQTRRWCARRGSSAPAGATSWRRCCGWERARGREGRRRPDRQPDLHRSSGSPLSSRLAEGDRDRRPSRHAAAARAPGSSSRGRSSTAPARPWRSSRARPRSSRARLRARPTRCSRASAAPRSCPPGRRGSTPTWGCAREAARDRRGRLHRLDLRAAVRRGARPRRARQAHLRRPSRERARGRGARRGRHRGPRRRHAGGGRRRRDRELRRRVARGPLDRGPGRVRAHPRDRHGRPARRRA